MSAHPYIHTLAVKNNPSFRAERAFRGMRIAFHTSRPWNNAEISFRVTLCFQFVTFCILPYHLIDINQPKHNPHSDRIAGTPFQVELPSHRRPLYLGRRGCVTFHATCAHQKPSTNELSECADTTSDIFLSCARTQHWSLLSTCVFDRFVYEMSQV